MATLCCGNWEGQYKPERFLCVVGPEEESPTAGQLFSPPIPPLPLIKGLFFWLPCCLSFTSGQLPGDCFFCLFVFLILKLNIKPRDSKSQTPLDLNFLFKVVDEGLDQLEKWTLTHHPLDFTWVSEKIGTSYSVWIVNGSGSNTLNRSVFVSPHGDVE